MDGSQAKGLINIGSYKILSVEDGIRTVAAKVLKGQSSGDSGRHISKSKGDTLTVCRQPNSKVPPKGFTSKKGSGHVLNILGTGQVAFVPSDRICFDSGAGILTRPVHPALSGPTQ